MDGMGVVEEIKKAVPALIFIPDISGYTQFISSAKLNESGKLIHELMEVIIDSNVFDFKIGEIEGDAILFYQTGEPLSISQIECQVKKTFLDFQKALYVMEQEHTLLSEAQNLTIKFIVHYGEVITTQIKGISKLMGSNIVLAHRILKNNIKTTEYLLLTEDYLKTQKKEDIKSAFEWSSLHSGRKKYDHIGNVNYKYTSLTPLRQMLPDFSISCR